MLPSIAKLCAPYKQHIAHTHQETLRMNQKTLNRVLAENLRTYLDRAKLSENALGKRANISPRTIANYCDLDAPKTSTGKDRSAKLVEIEKIADALGVPPLELLTDAAVRPPISAAARQVAELMDRMTASGRRVMYATAQALLSPDGAGDEPTGPDAAPPRLPRPGAS